MMKIANRASCVGCGLCKIICARGAIEMREDNCGFLVPSINSKKCTQCQRCANVCPVNRTFNNDDRFTPDFYGGAAKSQTEALSSTSGGLASVIARRIIRDGGIVFGAAFDPFPIVRHVGIEDEKSIDRLKGSKYVESDLQNAFPKIKSALADTRKVLFIGLPCHVAAVRSFLCGADENLITIDLVCHGKPPQKLFSHWIKQLEKSRKGKITEYAFRVKTDCNWNDARTYLHFCRFSDGREERISNDENWYSRYFLGSASFRNCCYNCQFAKMPRVGDITLADFWGVDRVEPFSDMIRSGVSLICVNTFRGRKVLADVGDELKLIKVSRDFAQSSNGGLIGCSKRVLYRSFVYHYAYLPRCISKIVEMVLFGVGRLIRKAISHTK